MDIPSGILWFYSCVSIVTLLLAVSRAQNEAEPPQPRFLNTPQNFTFHEGELARLECSLENLGTKKVIWRKSSDPNPLTIGRKTFVDDTRVMVEHIPLTPDWPLLIKQVRLDDEGQYECQVASRDRELRRYVNLIVLPGIKRKRVRPGNSKVLPHDTGEIRITGHTYVEKSGSIRLICNATGEDHSPDDIDWFLNGQKLITDDANEVYIHKRVSLTDKTIYSSLEIKSADMSDAGIYVCRTSDLQIASARVDVLNADTNNVKRDGADPDHRYAKDSNRKGKYDSRVTAGNFASSLSPKGTILSWMVSFLSVLLWRHLQISGSIMQSVT
ncbi:peroxidasin homolog isoform X2 [Pomacea canaliculata]|uniref:peroxidasin homolog isoform X2 n=1 Tax=Pomacea canaliculata TaxID=400727 RepID=UPI000D7287BC|nr:peroxidasin homolog isoform X2 [Pomacea canaliculata]